MENTMVSYSQNSINRVRETYVYKDASINDIKRKCLDEVKRTFAYNGRGVKMSNIEIDYVDECAILGTRLVRWHLNL